MKSDQWKKLQDGNLPRKGEIILVKNTTVYPRVLIADGPHDWYEYKEEHEKDYEQGNFAASGCKLSIHGITHWLRVGEF